MQSVSWVPFFVIGLIAFLALTFIVLSRILRRVQLKHANQVMEELAGEGILSIASNANFFGQKSKGHSQIRGNGIWALTPKRIYFKLFVPGRVIEIPLDRVTDTGSARRFLGKMVVGVELLLVTFTDDTGQTDQVAWALSDVPLRQEIIREAAGKIG
jgi:hypothetical protein